MIVSHFNLEDRNHNPLMATSRGWIMWQVYGGGGRGRGRNAVAFRFSEICFISGFWEKRRFVFNFKIKVRAVGTAGVGERRQSRPVAACTPAQANCSS